MIGVFDSGVGGLCAYREIRKRLPLCNVIYLADRRNAPYGTKSKEEILKFTETNIKLLKSCGAERILIACCTASTMHHLLRGEEKEISIPIITPAAKVAAASGRKIAVIATRHTAASGAFSREIAKFSDSEVCELDEQPLVSLVERGNRDGRVSAECMEYLRGLALRVKESGAEALVLGCTHFSHLEIELGRLLPEVRIVSPARVGAIMLAEEIKAVQENGKVIYKVAR